jgi:hypothetical protein
VYTLGMVLKARVHTADLQDRTAVAPALEGAAEEFPRLEHLWVDQGDTGTGKAWGSRNISDGAWRWSSISPSRGASGNRASILPISLLCISSGFGFHLNRRDFARRSR